MIESKSQYYIRSLLKLEISKPVCELGGTAYENTTWRLPDGNIHRDFGPAVEHADGAKEWWIQGKEHREDGPAVELKSGDVEYYLYGIKVSQKEFEFWKQDNKKE